MKKEILTNLIIPGAAKSGTSSLHEYLNAHAGINMSTIKEPHFFSIDRQFQKGVDFYNSLYENNKPACRYYGESSTTYLNSFESHLKIKALIPGAKFIIILRNPIDRLYSHYQWMYNLSYESSPFKKAIEEDKNVVFNPNKSINGCYKNYLGSSLYAKSIDHLQSLFGKENVLILTTENLHANLDHTLSAISHFLKLPPFPAINKIEVNKTKDIIRVDQPLLLRIAKGFAPVGLKRKVKGMLNQFLQKHYGNKVHHSPLDKESRLWLKEHFHKDVLRLKEISDCDFSTWKDFND